MFARKHFSQATRAALVAAPQARKIVHLLGGDRPGRQGPGLPDGLLNANNYHQSRPSTWGLPPPPVSQSAARPARKLGGMAP